jgi:hypothetical protein
VIVYNTRWCNWKGWIIRGTRRLRSATSEPALLYGRNCPRRERKAPPPSVFRGFSQALCKSTHLVANRTEVSSRHLLQVQVADARCHPPTRCGGSDLLLWPVFVAGSAAATPVPALAAIHGHERSDNRFSNRLRCCFHTLLSCTYTRQVMIRCSIRIPISIFVERS